MTHSRNRWGSILALAIAMLVVSSDLTLAAVALPGIGADLDVGPSATAWVLLAYALPTAAVAIPAGRWADRADIRWVFVLSMAGVGLAGAATAVAPQFWVLVAARFVQGAAAALTMAVYMPIVAAGVAREQRGRAIGYIITVMTLGGTIGAPLGGLVADGFGWRGVFWMKLPLVLVAMLVGVRTIGGNRKRLPVPDRSLLRDVALSGGAITALLLAFDRLTAQPWTAAGLGLVAVVLGAFWLRLPATRELTTVVRARTLGLPLLGLFLISFLIGLISFLLPYFISGELHADSSTMGIALLCFSGAMVPVAPIAGALADRFGPHRIALGGAIVSAAGLATLLTLDGSAGLADLGWRLVLLGIGGGLFNGPVNTALMAATPADRIGTAGGLFATVRTLATTIGPAVVALVWTVSGGGTAGFVAGVATLFGLHLAGIAALVAGRPSRAPASCPASL